MRVHVYKCACVQVCMCVMGSRSIIREFSDSYFEGPEATEHLMQEIETKILLLKRERKGV